MFYKTVCPFLLKLKSQLSTDVVVTDSVIFQGCADIFCNKDCHLKFLQSTFAGIELLLKAIKEQVRNQDNISSVF